MAGRAFAAAIMLLVLGAPFLAAEELPAADLWSRANAAADSGEFAEADRQLAELLNRGALTGIVRYPLLARSAAGLAEQAHAEGNAELADWAIAAARRLDRQSPAAALAAADLAKRRGEWGTALQSAMTGLTRTFGDYSSSLLARMDMLMMLCFAIAATAAAFAIVLLIRHGRPASHDFREILSRRLSPGVATVVAFALLFLPLFLWLGPVWLVLWWLALFFAYGNVREKIAIVVLIVALGAVPLLMEYAATRLAGLQNPVVRAAIADRDDAWDDAALLRMQSLIEAQPEEPLLHLLLGNLYFQQGSDTEALVHFRRAVQLDEDLAGAHLNIGNLHFLNNDYTAAISRYERAGDMDPRLAIAPFNQSVAAAQMNRYDEQARQLERARERNRSVVNQLTDEPPAQKVATYELPISDAWALAAELARRGAAPEVFGTYAWFDPARSVANRLTTAAAIALVLAFLLTVIRRKSGVAGSCIKCGRTFCSRCKSARESATYCTQCIHIYLKRDGVSLDTKRRKLDEVQEFQTRSTRARRILSALLPGSARAYEGRAFTGILVLLLFFLFIAVAVLVGRVAPIGPSADMLRIVLRTVALGAAVLIWILFSIPAMRERAG